MSGFFKGGVSSANGNTNFRLCVSGRVNIYTKAVESYPGLEIDYTQYQQPKMRSLPSYGGRSVGTRKATNYMIFPFETGECAYSSNIHTISIPVGSIGWLGTGATEVYKVEVITTAWNYWQGTEDVAKIAEVKRSATLSSR
jgi:hypothetical protein